MNRFLSVLLKKLPGWTGEPIGEENLQAALAVLESNRAGYYTHIQEEWPTEENLRKDITALPPGRSLSDKTFVLLYREGVPAAVVDYVEGYPDETTGYVGLFLLDRGLHRQGVGTTLFSALEAAALETGKTRLELGCYETNGPGLSFWHKQGFTELRRKPRTGTDGKTRMLLAMGKNLDYRP